MASFTCPRCGMTSSHPEDAKQGYCGRCHDWTGQVVGGVPSRGAPEYVIAMRAADATRTVDGTTSGWACALCKAELVLSPETLPVAVAGVPLVCAVCVVQALRGLGYRIEFPRADGRG